MAAFAELAEPLDPLSWRDLRAISGPLAVLQVDPDVEPQPPWSVLERFNATLMTFTASALDAPTDPRVRVLDDSDLDSIRTLAVRSAMGDFPAHGLRFGQHLGVRLDGRLVAMAGRRFVIGDRVEIGWVSTDPDHRRMGLASAVVVALCRRILAEARTPFLIVVDGNPAAALYRHLGFTPVERIHGLAVTRPRSSEA